MKAQSKLLVSVLLVLLAFSCQKNKERDDSKIRERYYLLEKAGWKSKMHTQKIDDIGFTAIEVPILYYLLKNEEQENLFKTDSLYEQNKKERVIEFVFEQEEEKDLLDETFTGISYEDGLKYLSFSIDKDFYVVTSKKDTIHCSGVSYERNYKIAPYQKVMLFFSGIDPNDKIQLVYNDRLFKKGMVKFKFKDRYIDLEK